MKRNIIIITLAIIIILVGANAVYAQEPATTTTIDLGSLLNMQLPETAVEAVGLLANIIFGLFSLSALTELFTNGLKKIDVWIQKKTKAKEELMDSETETRIGGFLAQITALLVAAVLVFVSKNWLLTWASFLDTNGIWPIVLSVFGMAQLLYRRK